MANESDTLFDMSEYAGDEKVRKAPESEAEKRLRKGREVEDRGILNLHNAVNRGEKLTDAQWKTLRKYNDKNEFEAGNNLPDNMVRTKKEVGLHFNRCIRTIKNWGSRGMPTKFEGYDLIDIETWALREGLIKQAISKTGESVGNGDKKETVDDGTGEIEPKDRAYYEKEIKKLDAELKTIKVQKENGLLIARADVSSEWTARAIEYSNSYDWMETRLVTLICSLLGVFGVKRKELRILLHKEFRAVKDNLFRKSTYCPTPEDIT